MNVSASGYNNKYFELALAVDPVILDKVIGDAGTGPPQTIIIIIIASVVGGGAGVSIVLVWYFIKKRAIKP